MMNEQLIPHYTLDDTNEDTLIYETSYVANPATGKGFLAFSESDKAYKQVEQKFYMIEDKTQRMTSGVWFSPDTKYLRVDPQGNYYTVSISKEDLKAALLRYLKAGYANTGSLEHGDLASDKFVAIEHWIIEGPKTKSPIYGLTLEQLGYDPATIPVGTVMKTSYVADEQFWNEEVLTGNVTGYSISGLFTLKLQVGESFNETTDTLHDTTPAEVQEQAAELGNGTLEVGDKEYVVQEGYVVDESQKETKEEQAPEVEPQISPVSDDIKEGDTTSQDVKEMVSKSDYDALQAQLDALKADYEAKLQESEQNNKTLRKEIVNKPIVNDKTFTKSTPTFTKQITLGGKTIKY